MISWLHHLLMGGLSDHIRSFCPDESSGERRERSYFLYIFPIQRGAAWSYLEFPNHQIYIDTQLKNNICWITMLHVWNIYIRINGFNNRSVFSTQDKPRLRHGRGRAWLAFVAAVCGLGADDARRHCGSRVGESTAGRNAADLASL